MRKKESSAMAFFHADGLPAAWQHATRFAGKHGRIATLPDIVNARLASKPGDAPWETYYTTLSAEYFGKSREGKMILIVAHGVGPMSTLDGIHTAYGHEYKDKDRLNRGGRITQEQFWDLEDGKFGEVSIIDFTSYIARYKYPFIEALRVSQAMTDDVLKARLGPNWLAYLSRHEEISLAWHQEQVGIAPTNHYHIPRKDHAAYAKRHMTEQAEAVALRDPFIIYCKDPGNCCYAFGENGYREPGEGFAIAHLLSTGRFSTVQHERGHSLMLDIGCHEWWNSVRLVGVNGKDPITNIFDGPNIANLIRRTWKQLLEPFTGETQIGMRAMMKIDDQWFTQTLKTGARMDTQEPEFVIRSVKPIGQAVQFQTTGCGSIFFKFGMQEITAIAPPKANGYFFLTEPEKTFVGNVDYHIAMVQFFQIDVDTTKRLIGEKTLARDPDRLMQLHTQTATSL